MAKVSEVSARRDVSRRSYKHPLPKTQGIRRRSIRRRIPLQNDFLTIAENSPDVICRFNKKFHHTFVNSALEKNTGIPSKNFIGRTPHEAGLPPFFADLWVQMLTTVFTTLQPYTSEFSFPAPGGERHFHALLVPEFNRKGDVETVLSITRDITEMKEKQAVQEEYLNIASHELKTPLTALKAFTQLLQVKLQDADDVSTAGYLEKIQSHIDRLNRLVNDLLDVKTTVSGKKTFTFSSFDFDRLVKEVVDDMQHTTAHKLSINGTSGKTIIADKDKIAQVLINLISNAIKYSPGQDQVIIQIASTADGVICCVRDFGLGIPQDQQAHIFDRYYRVNEGASVPAGLGLGLYICAEIIARHGGKIWVDSEPDKGSTFCFTLPLKQK